MWQEECRRSVDEAPNIYSQRWTASEYGRASEQAHCVLGLSLALTILVWGHQVIYCPLISTSSRRAGVVALWSGTYLLAWVAWYSDGPDLIQIQHFAISLCLIAAGCAEIVGGLHRAWFANLACVALVFLGHPQRTVLATFLHSAIGLTLLVGTFFLLQEKQNNFPKHSMDAPISSAFVGTTCLLLVAYREPQEKSHYHRHIPPDACAPGLHIALGGGMVAIGTFLFLTVHLLRKRRRRLDDYVAVARIDDEEIRQSRL